MAAITAGAIGRDACANRATSLRTVSRCRWHPAGHPAASVARVGRGVERRSATLRGWLGAFATPVPAHDTTSGGWVVKRYSKRGPSQSLGVLDQPDGHTGAT